MIKCVIVDDEPLAQQVLESYILQTRGLILAGRCANALQALDLLSREKTDLLFLDIKMPGLSGIDLIRSLKTPPPVIFTTACSEYAVMSYELEAIDYLLKPVTFERFCIAMAKFLDKQARLEPERSYSYFKVSGKLVKVRHADIIFAQSIKDYILIGTTGGNHIVHMTMKGLAELLPPSMFIRVHRSFLIGTSHVTVVGKNSIALGEKTIPIGENYKIGIDQWRKNYP